ncbi:MAG: sulfatase-like hydrolase/transferase [Lachnospiraceae bacterium]|nr:sulfatase-like hydrolase/transferase [Lachnospiraceae bacterium]
MKFTEFGNRFARPFFRRPFAQVFALAAALALLVDSFSRESFLRALGAVFTNPLVFLYNMLIIAITLAPALFFTRRIFFYAIVSLLWVIIGVTDFVLLQFRTTPFTFVDLTMIQSAIGIWDHYLTIWQLILIATLLIAAILGCVALFRKVKKQEKLPVLRVAKSLILMVACAIVATDVGVSLKLLSENFGNLADAYHKYGLPYCFVNGIFNTGIDKPKKYSDEYVQKIVKAIENGTLVTSTGTNGPLSPLPVPEIFPTSPTPGELPPSVTPQPTQTPPAKEEIPESPNILFLQLESFFDPTSIVGSTFTKDPIPNYHRLMENFTSDYLYVPSIGAGTANTEFEVITGMNLDFFGPGEYPYKTILLETTCESIGYVLKNRGYGTHAIHNNDGTFYGRHLVFPNLGFDSFTSVEYMDNVIRTPLAWAKDSILTEEIKKALDSTEEPDFIYTISVQGHGSYPDREVLTDPAVDLTLPEHLSSLYYPLLYYTNQIHEMDQFVAELIKMLENRGEDTVLVMYGDHLPGFKLTEEDLGGTSLFATQYVIWSNFELEAKRQDLEAYQLYSYVLDRLNIHEGIINGFHQTQKDSALYLEELEILEYDMLYGKQNCYAGKNPYAPAKMKMGIDPILLTGIRAFGSTAGNKVPLPEDDGEDSLGQWNEGDMDTAGTDGINSSWADPSGNQDSLSSAANDNPEEQPDSKGQNPTLSSTPEPKKEDGGGFWSIFGKKDQNDTLYTVFFLGSGFTPYSYVQLDGKELETMFVSDTVLSAVMPLPDLNTKITVVQHGPDDQVLSSSEPLIITEQLLKNIFPAANPELEGED